MHWFIDTYLRRWPLEFVSNVVSKLHYLYIWSRPLRSHALGSVCYSLIRLLILKYTRGYLLILKWNNFRLHRLFSISDAFSLTLCFYNSIVTLYWEKTSLLFYLLQTNNTELRSLVITFSIKTLKAVSICNMPFMDRQLVWFIRMRFRIRISY